MRALAIPWPSIGRIPLSQHLCAFYVAIHLQFRPLVQALWMSHASHAIGQNPCILHRGVLYTLRQWAGCTAPIQASDQLLL